MKAAQPVPRNVDEYIAGFPPDVQRVLSRVRSTIRRAVPRAEESISYRIPTYKLEGRPVIYFAGWTEHYALYPSNKRLVAAFRTQLAAYEVNDKGTIRFPLRDPVPVRLIAKIAQFRAAEEAAARRSRRPRTASTRRRPSRS
jgi:uncharacterized protein YdhG (YjbR/CyaY superfamily)